MKKLFASIFTTLMLCSVCFFAACNVQGETSEPTKEPLTMQDCFKDFVASAYYKFSYKPDGYEDKPYRGENVSFSELIKSENNIDPDCYSYFKIYTTEKAASIKVTSISFEVVVTTDCLMQFCLWTSENSSIYSDDSVSAEAGTPVTITFSSLNKRWTAEQAGQSELRSGWMIGEPSTYLKLELIGKGMLIDNNYTIRNLKIEFVED